MATLEEVILETVHIRMAPDEIGKIEKILIKLYDDEKDTGRRKKTSQNYQLAQEEMQYAGIMVKAGLVTENTSLPGFYKLTEKGSEQAYVKVDAILPDALHNRS